MKTEELGLAIKFLALILEDREFDRGFHMEPLEYDLTLMLLNRIGKALISGEQGNSRPTNGQLTAVKIQSLSSIWSILKREEEMNLLNNPHDAKIVSQWISHLTGPFVESSVGMMATQLTDREKEVLCLIAEGLRNKEISARIKVGVRTVETHRERIMRKLDIHDVAGLTIFAIKSGMKKLD